MSRNSNSSISYEDAMQAIGYNPPRQQRKARPVAAKTEPVILTLSTIIKTERRRSFHDQRHMVFWTVAEYRGSDGEDYRKSFEAKSEPPVIPTSGTHSSIQPQLKQWK